MTLTEETLKDIEGKAHTSKEIIAATGRPKGSTSFAFI